MGHYIPYVNGLYDFKRNVDTLRYTANYFCFKHVSMFDIQTEILQLNFFFPKDFFF